MTRRNQLVFALLFLALSALGCSLGSTPVPAQTETLPPQPINAVEPLPFEGMWVSEGDAPELIILTRDSMYWVESDQVAENQTGARERFASIVSCDLENNHISLFTQWIRVNGQMFGFDAPNFNITYQIDGDSLRVGMGWDDEFAAQTEPLVYMRK